MLCFCQNASQLRPCRSSQLSARERRAAWSEPPPKNLESHVTLAPGSTSVSSTHVVSPSVHVFKSSFPLQQGVVITKVSASWVDHFGLNRFLKVVPLKKTKSNQADTVCSWVFAVWNNKLLIMNATETFLMDVSVSLPDVWSCYILSL